MNIIEIIRIRRLNKKIKDIERQSKRNKCCESCKFCILSEITLGYEEYSCLLKNPNFDGMPENIYHYKCNHYKPCRKFRKYLELIGDE